MVWRAQQLGIFDIQGFHIACFRQRSKLKNIVFCSHKNGGYLTKCRQVLCDTLVAKHTREDKVLIVEPLMTVASCL